MQKLSKPFAAISYIFAAALLAVYFGTEFVPSFFLSTAGRLVLLCVSCGFLWLGGFFLTKRSGNNRPMKINLRIFLALYLLLFATLTLFDPLWGRNGGFVIWNRELFEMYVQNSLNLVPFKTVLQYFYRGTINQFVVNIVGNLVCLMPLGILLPLNFEKQRKTGIFLMTCVLIVSAVEILQFATLSGSCDIDDFILNVGGAFLIYLFTKNKKAFGFLKQIFLLE
ncbi:MAG: VanZ family protein [Oscillospiraceae bacterium]|nr:VanZ family protein [Oscillospiraceae bacterium]